MPHPEVLKTSLDVALSNSVCLPVVGVLELGGLWGFTSSRHSVILGTELGSGWDVLIVQGQHRHIKEPMEVLFCSI